MFVCRLCLGLTRLVINILVVALLAASFYLVYFVTHISFGRLTDFQQDPVKTSPLSEAQALVQFSNASYSTPKMFESSRDDGESFSGLNSKLSDRNITESAVIFAESLTTFPPTSLDEIVIPKSSNVPGKALHLFDSAYDYSDLDYESYDYENLNRGDALFGFTTTGVSTSQETLPTETPVLNFPDLDGAASNSVFTTIISDSDHTSRMPRSTADQDKISSEKLSTENFFNILRIKTTSSIPSSNPENDNFFGEVSTSSLPKSTFDSDNFITRDDLHNDAENDFITTAIPVTTHQSDNADSMPDEKYAESRNNEELFVTFTKSSAELNPTESTTSEASILMRDPPEEDFVRVNTRHLRTTQKPLKGLEAVKKDTTGSDVVKTKLETDENDQTKTKTLIDFVYQYLPSATIIALNTVVPLVFNRLVEYERYSTNFILRITLFRTVALRLVSLGVLLYTLKQRTAQCAPNPRSTIGGVCAPCGGKITCWETYVGQELYKLTILDLLAMMGKVFLINLPRHLIGYRLCGHTKLGRTVGELDFGIPTNVLDVVYGQTLCWLGMFYAPLLPGITGIKLILVFYIKYFDCTVNGRQSSQFYRTSRSNSLFITISLISFVVTMIPVSYSFIELTPSVGCGPFRGLASIWQQMILLIASLPSWGQSFVFFLGTSGFGVPAVVLISLAAYYYYAVAAANKELVLLLKGQLVLDGHDKQFLITRLDSLLKKVTIFCFQF